MSQYQIAWFGKWDAEFREEIDEAKETFAIQVVSICQ